MKEKLQNKLTIPLIALAIVGVGGSVYTISHTGPTTASAQSAQVSTAPDKAENANDKPDVAGEQSQKPNYTSSIRIPESSKEMDDATEAKQLASFAKINSDQAKSAAEKSAGGTASTVKLEEEHGNVVYAVTVGTKEVKVDAGNGNVLTTETAEAGKNEGNNESGSQ